MDGNGNGEHHPSSGEDIVRIAAVGDLHCTKNSRGAYQALFNQIAQSADVLVLCGDMTDYGLPEEAQVLVKEMSGMKLPTVAVLGNHDYEAGHVPEITKIFTDAGITILDGDATVIKGVGFAGCKGFGGGFGRGTLGAWGEPAIKAFVQEAINESIKLESALARLRTPHRIAVLHYAPIKATVENEPVEIFPWLGCSRLEEPLNRYQVTAVIHGHAHKGSPEGKTASGAPVYNVCIPLMRTSFPDRPPYRLLTVRVTQEHPEGQQVVGGATASEPMPSRGQPVSTEVR